MEYYPDEIRTPPVSLIALVGCPELHTMISTHLNSEKPPVNTLALPDFLKITVLIKSHPKQSPGSDPSTPTGVLKKNWLLKHRTRVPAVIAAFFKSDHVSGDPAQWLEISSHLDTLKAIILGQNIKMVVVVVQSTSNDDMSEDRIQALRKRAEVDSKYLINFLLGEEPELKQSLNKLWSTFAELAITYYRDEGRRIKTRIERKSFSSIEFHIRYCFKVAVYAEFRRDWAEALRFYEDAYHTLGEMSSSTTKMLSVQRLVEIKTVAEQLHFKILNLLLHGGKVIQAVTWFHQHIASYKSLVGLPQVIFLHWEWISRQFLVFAELLETSSASVKSVSPTSLNSLEKPLTEWEYQPAYYYQLAAHYLKEKRTCLELALSMTETINESNGSVESVAPSVYVGQYTRLLEPEDAFGTQQFGDEEFTSFVLAEGKRFFDSSEIIVLLKKSSDSYNTLKCQRMVCYCGLQIAREYFAVGDFINAKHLFDSATSLYRQEGWVTLMWGILGYLRECSRQQGLLKDFVEYSLEIAALPVSSTISSQSSNVKNFGPAGPANFAQREFIHREVFEFVRGELELEPNSDGNRLKVKEDSPIYLEIDLVSPLRVALLVAVSFHEQAVKPGAPTLVTFSLLSQLPLPVEIDQIEIQFNQSHCNFMVRNTRTPPLVAISNVQQSYRVENTPLLSLLNNKWLRLTYDISSEQVGKLECTSVIVRIGSYFTVCCRAENPSSMDGLPLWKFEDRVESFPTKNPALSFSGQKAIQVEEPEPRMDLNICVTGPALVGESFIIPVTVASKGHAVFSGELKINLVDYRGSVLLSPRDLEPSSVDNPHVELLSISELHGPEISEKGSDNIKKIQQSFGLVSIPKLNDGDSWSCKLEIKWHRPKPVMLFVSLGYSPYGDESAEQKVHVHKSLQIEGKIAVTLDHRFMFPFRRDALLISKIKTSESSDSSTSLPLNETSVLIITAKNCISFPLELVSMSIEFDDDVIEGSCLVQQSNDGVGLIPPGEDFKKIFSMIPKLTIPVLKLGTVHMTWRRGPGQPSILMKYRLPDASVESSPLVVSLDCPPHAVLGNPFAYFVIINNQTRLLQEIKFSLEDSQSFVLSGSHNDTIHVLPKSEHVLSYKLVPLASGSLQLPRVMVTLTRYSVGYLPSVDASTVFVFPSECHFKTAAKGADVVECIS